MRIIQKQGSRGSLKWIQKAVNGRSFLLDEKILEMIPGAASVVWRSPLATDGHAEYRDHSFLELLDLPHLKTSLDSFWPRRGPQWDALGLTDRRNVLLVEAKAHAGELCSPGSAAGPASRAVIERSLEETAHSLGAAPRAPWSGVFYQLANRLAHLDFLRRNDVPAWLVLVNFIGDRERNGPATRAEWEAAYGVVFHVMGLKSNHRLSRFILHIYPDVALLAD
ncbi:MAG: hypothetical protein H0T56_01275 [Pseudaminobacter sp.]|nr:hypothetical protein [Pseudaminobacter sp.]